MEYSIINLFFKSTNANKQTAMPKSYKVVAVIKGYIKVF